MARRSRSRGSVDGVVLAADDDQVGQFVAKRGPKPAIGAGAGQQRPDLGEAGLELLQRDRLARRGDDRADRLRLRIAEALAQQAFEIAETDAAIERAPGGEGDQQPLGPIGIADRSAGVGADLAHPLLELRDAARDVGVDHDRAGVGILVLRLRLQRLGGRRRARLLGDLDGLRHDPEIARGRLPADQQPGHRGQPEQEGEQCEAQRAEPRAAPRLGPRQRRCNRYRILGRRRRGRRGGALLAAQGVGGVDQGVVARLGRDHAVGPAVARGGGGRVADRGDPGDRPPLAGSGRRTIRRHAANGAGRRRRH